MYWHVVHTYSVRPGNIICCSSSLMTTVVKTNIADPTKKGGEGRIYPEPGIFKGAQKFETINFF